MRKTLRAVAAALLGGAVVTGCALTVEEAQQQFANDIRTRGGNPYIEAPVVRDLEERIEAIFLARHIRDGSYADRFDPRNEAVLANFEDRFDRKEFDTYMALADQGFEAAVAALYPQIGPEFDSNSGCALNAAEAAFPRGGGVPLKFDWRLERGDCADGFAQGVGRAVSADGSAVFVGTFDRGLMREGVFHTRLAAEDRDILVIGGVPQQELIGRHLAAFTQSDGGRWFYYGDIRSDAAMHGFGLKVSDPPESRLVTVIGEFRDDRLNGFGATQFKVAWDETYTYYGARIGYWQDGKSHGLAAYTDGAVYLDVGEYQNHKEHGVMYAREGSWEGVYHVFSVGTYRNGEKHGTFYLSEATSIDDQWTNEEYWRNGERTGSTRWVDNVDLGQIFALGAASTVIATADIPSVAQMEIGGALVSDVFNGTGPNALNNLQARYAAAAQSSQSGSSSGGSQSSSGGGPLKTYNATFTCPETGRQANIPVPYRTEICRVAAIDFAKTFACNKMDQERVMRNCQAACGDPQCLQQ
jgi:hypothetical protein